MMVLKEIRQHAFGNSCFARVSSTVDVRAEDEEREGGIKERAFVN